MNKPTMTDEWPIYNSHIHTFTRAHTPKNFIKWVLADGNTGRIDWLRLPLYFFFIFLYFVLLFLLANYVALLSTHLDAINLPVYAFLLLFEAVLVIPALIVAFIVLALIVLLLMQGFVDWLLKIRAQKPSASKPGRLHIMARALRQGQKMVLHPNILVRLLVGLNPASSNDIFERMARFLRIASEPSQAAIFDEIKLQYPPEQTRFVVLPMDMGFMKLGRLPTSIEKQHAELWTLAQKSNGQIIPFYAADPRHPDIVDRVKENLAKDKFQGIKIYPNLGYPPDHPRLLEIYKICIEGNFPVMTHCSPGGIWQYGLARKDRRAYSRPKSYKCILEQKEYRNLKICLAHFGGAEEWAKQLNRELRIQKDKEEENPEEPWVKTIYDMIASGRYPNLYTDISYTAFTPRIPGLYIDLIDYLKVLLSNPLVRKRVLFGSDYYMVEQERVSEKEASVLLRSRLGEDLYKQIAYTNPMEYLSNGFPGKAAPVKKKRLVRP
jgi:uncharacterized protein